MGHKLRLLLFTFVLLIIYFGACLPAYAAPLTYPTARLAGQRQIDTAVAVSQEGWQEAKTVLLANANSYPDALVAAPLAHRLDAPILLTNTKVLDDQVSEELKRLQTEHVILLGGEAVLAPEIVQSLEAAGLTWERIDGYDRYETAAKVADRVGVKNQVILVNGQQFPDALSVSAYAGLTETPLLLTKANEMPDFTRTEISTLLDQAIASEGTVKTLVIGGEAVVSDKILKDVPGIERIAGNDRYGTAAKVYLYAKDILNSPTAYLVSGENFPDALVAGPLAAKKQAGIFMSRKSELPPETYSALGTAGDNGLEVYLVGGNAVLDSNVKAMVEGTLQPKYLLAGVTITIDPGHGGPDPGAAGKTTVEKNNNLAVSLILADLLRSAGAKVVLTRTTDTVPTGGAYAELPDLGARVAIANNAKSDLFISIHNDSYSTPTVGGTTTYFSSGNPSAANSKILAQNIQSEAIKAMGLATRGVKDAAFYVIKNTTMPAVLIELGFISNPTEEKLLASPDFQTKAAQGIYRGILVYRGY